MPQNGPAIAMAISMTLIPAKGGCVPKAFVM
jgi:hypothetical protein